MTGAVGRRKHESPGGCVCVEKIRLSTMSAVELELAMSKVVSTVPPGNRGGNYNVRMSPKIEVKAPSLVLHWP